MIKPIFAVGIPRHLHEFRFQYEKKLKEELKDYYVFLYPSEEREFKFQVLSGENTVPEEYLKNEEFKKAIENLYKTLDNISEKE